MIKKIAAISFSPTGSTRDLVDKAAEAVGKGLVVGLEEGAFDHGGATRLFMQSYCLVKFCH